MRFIFLNGPPRCGKDTAAIAIYHHLLGKQGNSFLEKMSLPIKRAFGGTTNSTFDYESGYNVEHEPRKEQKIGSLGVSYRQWQIDFSEKFMKPLYGDAIFGQLLLERVSYLNSDSIVIVSDCGFQIEVDTIMNTMWSGHVLILRIHRAGYTFDNDSRQYITHASAIDVRNDDTIADLEAKLIPIVNTWSQQ